MTRDLIVTAVEGNVVRVGTFAHPDDIVLDRDAMVSATNGKVSVAFKAPCQEWRVGDRISWTQYRSKEAS